MDHFQSEGNLTTGCSFYQEIKIVFRQKVTLPKYILLGQNSFTIWLAFHGFLILDRQCEPCCLLFPSSIISIMVVKFLKKNMSIICVQLFKETKPIIWHFHRSKDVIIHFHRSKDVIILLWPWYMYENLIHKGLESAMYNSKYHGYPLVTRQDANTRSIVWRRDDLQDNHIVNFHNRVICFDYI